jgi:hypothetical protein
MKNEIYYNRRTDVVTREQRGFLDGVGKFTPKRFPAQRSLGDDMLEIIADQQVTKILHGDVRSKHNKFCTNCFVRFATNGSCNC